MSLVSVVIPCYNAENYIQRCINALENQTFKDFTLILVDDCSADSTVEKIKNISTELDIVLLENEQNRGPAFSRNRALEYANSEYVTFCDCDDWYEPDFLSEMYGILAEYEADIALCGYNVVDEKGGVQKRPILQNKAVFDSSLAFCLEADSLCMLMVKTDIMKNTMLPDIRNGEDVAVVPLLIAKAQRCAVTDKCLYNYFRRDGSASQKPTMRVVDSLINAFSYTEKNFPADKLQELEYLGIKNMLYSTIISLFTFGYDTKKAKYIINSFEKTYPKWHKNYYFGKLSLYKKIVLILTKLRFWSAIKIIAALRAKVI